MNLTIKVNCTDMEKAKNAAREILVLATEMRINHPDVVVNVEVIVVTVSL